MSEPTDLERLSQIQDEILGFTWEQVASRVEKFYVQGKLTADVAEDVQSVEGNLKYSIVDGLLVKNSDVLSDDEFEANSDFIAPRIVELHDLLVKLQGTSPVRFRWSVDTRTGQVESEWTYYNDLTPEEKVDDFWRYWKGDFAWRDQLQAELGTD